MEETVAVGVLLAQVVLYCSGERLTCVRAAWSQVRIWAVGVLLLETNKEVVAWVTAVFFPLTKLLSCYLSCLFPSESSLSSRLLVLNLTLSSLYLLSVLFSSTYTPALYLGLLCCPDIQLTVSQVLCGWQCPQDYWGRTLALCVFVQWGVVCGFPGDCGIFRDAVRTVYGNHVKLEVRAWSCPSVSLYLWIALLHLLNIMFRPNSAVLLMVLGLPVWLLVHLHEIYWPYVDQKANRVAHNMLQALWLWPLWLFWHSYWVLCVLLLFAMRNCVLT